MDIDPNDLLSTNVYISKPELKPSISKQDTQEFKKYYENEIQKQDEEQIRFTLKNINHQEFDDDNNMFNTHTFQKLEQQQPQQIERYIRENKTLVSIDSRDRIKTTYPKPNNFKMFLGRTFENVKKIEMVSLEFPNTDAVINTKNNKIYWRNQEDIDQDITVTTNGITSYPVYSVDLRVGSYTSTTLQNEIISKMNSVRRKQGTSNGNLVIGDYHYFITTLDLDTDVVTFTSLTLKQLANNPLGTSLGSGVISVTLQNHGFSTYDIVYILGAKPVAGIASSTLTGFYQITVINANTFTFEVTTKAADTLSGGGNVVKVGQKAPFQLLWGENSFTVAQNIGYPLENSSELIKTTLAPLQNLYQMIIQFATPHNFLNTYDYIGRTINIGYDLLGNFITYRTYQILNIPSTTTILVQVSDNSVADLLNNNVQAIIGKFGTILLDIVSYTTYNQTSILITTNTVHTYTLADIGATITLTDTADPKVVNDTNYDGDYIIAGVPSSTSLVVAGVLGNLNTHSSGVYGSMPRYKALTTYTLGIDDIVPNYININNNNYTKIVTSTDHNLNVGESVVFYNVLSTPPLVGSYIITSVLNSNSFLIQVNINTLDKSNITTTTTTTNIAYIGTGLVTVSFPEHGFNKIVNVANGISFNTTVGNAIVSNFPIIISTFNPHNLNVSDIIRLSNTNTTPSLDGGGYIVHEVINDDTFSIIRQPTQFTPLSIPVNITGILGLSNDFYVYNSIDVGGISKININGIRCSIRDIIDRNTFTFIVPNAYASSIEMGGGTTIYISSLKHGFNGVQDNTKNNVLNRSINLQGENYCFLTCPQLNTMLNTGNVKNIFARISLDQPPGYVCFKYLSNPKMFNTIPLEKLSELEFSVTNYDSSLYEFNDLDFSFTLEITEVYDATKSFNVSSRRGITDSH